MKLQLLSDLHLETERFDPRPAPGADLLVLAGDIDATWQGFAHFVGWPVPVIFVPGNHEYDDGDLDETAPALRAACEQAGMRLLSRESLVVDAPDGRRVRFVGCTRWSDFDLFGPVRRDKAMRAAEYFMSVMNATQGGKPFDAAAVREVGLADRAWLERELSRPASLGWDTTVVITHFGPSQRSADPRYGAQHGTASFCNADDDLIPRADLWLHGHLHCRHDYRVDRPGRRPTRVVCNARGLEHKGEADGHDPLLTIDC